MTACRWPKCGAVMSYSETRFCWYHLFWMLTVFFNLTMWSGVLAKWVFR